MTEKIDTAKLNNLVAKLNIGTIVLPNFQRDFVWEPDDWRSLIASLMLDYPVGMLLIGKDGQSDAYQMKKPLSIPSDLLCEKYEDRLSEESIEVPEDYDGPEQLLKKASDGFRCDFLLDGQQRLTAIDLVFGKAFAECPGDELHYAKRYRWFLNLTDLGLLDLDFKLDDMSHSEVKEAIVKMPYRLGDEQEYDIDREDLYLIDGFCSSNDISNSSDYWEDSYLVPFDVIYDIKPEKYDGNPNKINECFDADFSFVDELLDVKEVGLLKKTARKFNNGGVDDDYKERFKDKLREWRYKLRDLLTKRIPEFEIPIVKVPADEFKRIAGIFSVINKTGVDLHVFDLLVAKTAKYGETIRDSFNESVKEFENQKRSNIQSLLHQKILSKIDGNDFGRFWSVSSFLEEKSNIADEVNAGNQFPENNRKVYSQVITLLSRINRAINNNSDLTFENLWYDTDFEIIRNRDNENLAKFVQSVLDLGDGWKFGDDQIIDTRKSEVWDKCFANQAAKQLLRANLFCSTRLGIETYNKIPYKQMLLVIACALTDPIWEDITGENGRNHWRSKKIEKWYWGSIFGGAYQERQDARVCSDIPRLIVYLSTRSVSWSDISTANYDESEVNYQEKGIRGTENSRFDSVFDVRGYSDFDALKSKNRSLENAICSFECRNGMLDFKNPDGEYILLHTGINGLNKNKKLNKDHIIPLGAWNQRLSEDENKIDRRSDHPIHSPLNKTFITKESNNYWSDKMSFLKFELFDEDGHPDGLFADHNLNKSSLRHDYEEYKDILEGGNATDDVLQENLLVPLIRTRYEMLKNKVSNLCDEVP